MIQEFCGWPGKIVTGEDALLRDQQDHPRDAYPREWKLGNITATNI